MILFDGGITFNPSISLNGLIITAGTIMSAIFAWRDLNWRQKNTEDRQDRMEKMMERMNETLTKLDRLADKQDTRILLLERILDAETAGGTRRRTGP